MICWLQFDLYIKSLIVILLNHYTVIPALASIYDNSKQEKCSPLLSASKSCLYIVKVFIECLLHCLLNIRDAFFYVITCVYTS